MSLVMNMVRTCQVVRVILALSTGLLGAAERIGGHPGAGVPVKTLASPGPFTNLFFQSRAIAADGRTLQQERFWLLNDNVRLLKEELPNQRRVQSLKNLEEEDWRSAALLYELIITQKEAFSRYREPPGWKQRAEQLSADAKRESLRRYGRDDLIVAHARPPEQWSALSSPSVVTNFLSLYLLTVDGAIVEQVPIGEVGTGKWTGQWVEPVTGSQGILEIEFDPKTHLRLQERRWIGDRLVYESVLKTEVLIGLSQFRIPELELQEARAPYPYREQKLVGIGILIQPTDAGPFKILHVFPDSPAQKAGIRVNSQVVKIDEKETAGMLMDEFIRLLRGEAGTSVSIEVVGQPGQKPQQVNVERAEFVYKAYTPTTQKPMKEPEKSSQSAAGVGP